MTRRNDEIGDWMDGEGAGSGLALVGWGFGAVGAVVLAFASWQYAAPRPIVTEQARAEAMLPDPTEVTGSIAATDRGQTTVQPSRVVGASRIAPMPLAGNESVATSRDIDQLRSEIRDIQRRIVQIGLSGDGVSRRIDRIEERVAGLAAPGAPAVLAEANRPAETPVVEVAPEKPRPERTAERLPTPQPRPLVEIPAVPPGYDGDGPATTGAVPKPADRLEKAADRVETVEPKTGETKPAKSEAAPKGSRGLVPTAAAVTPTPAVAARAADHVDEPTAAPEAKPAAPVRIVSAQPPAPAQPPMPVVAPQAPPTSAETKPAGGPAAAIDLGGYRSLASLRRSWSDMTLRSSDVVKGLEPLARLRETDSGMEARLVAGPFADQTEAAKACLRVKAAGAYCAVTTHGGQPIGGLR